jgi:hypothetical protein
LWPECPRLGGLVAMGYPRPEATPDGHETSISSRSQWPWRSFFGICFASSARGAISAVRRTRRKGRPPACLEPGARKRAVDLSGVATGLPLVGRPQAT